MKWRLIIRLMERIVSGRNVSTQFNRGLRNSIIPLTLTYTSETWACNEAQWGGLCTVEMVYLRRVCVLTRWDGESSVIVYRRCCVDMRTNDVECEVVEWVKQNILTWFQHVSRMQNDEFVKKVHESQ